MIQKCHWICIKIYAEASCYEMKPQLSNLCFTSLTFLPYWRAWHAESRTTEVQKKVRDTQRGCELELSNLKYTVRAWRSSEDYEKIVITTLAYHRMFEMCIWKSPPGIICCHQQRGQNEPWDAAVKQHLSHGVQYTATAAYKMSVCPQRWLVFIRIRLDPEIKCPSLSTMTVLACSIRHKV